MWSLEIVMRKRATGAKRMGRECVHSTRSIVCHIVVERLSSREEWWLTEMFCDIYLTGGRTCY